jgi:hypothetical protein
VRGGSTYICSQGATLLAIRAMPQEMRPRKIIGCEVWRNLDWMPDGEKILMDVSGRDNLAAALNGVFDSQIAGGKRYDLAEEGLRHANATYFDSHTTDGAESLNFAMDMTPLIEDDQLDMEQFATRFVRRLEDDVRERVRRFM